MSLSGYKVPLFCALCALAVSQPVWAVESGRATDIRERYLEDRAACQSHASAEDRKTCLREAGAAQIEARQGTLGPDQANFDANKLARCDYHKGADEREYCLRRMRGEGTTSGTVEGGAIVRELVVVVPATE